MRLPHAMALARFMLLIGALVGSAGCHVARVRDNLASRLSFTAWNLSSRECAASHSTYARALELASRSSFELENVMASHSAPELDLLHGRWHGINKGVGAATIGLTQDIKVFNCMARCPHGYNVAVHQVGLKDLDCRGFEAKTKLLSDCEKTMGRFVIVQPSSSCQPLKLDYTQADNKLLDPSRVLIDEIVLIDNDLLLGRAYAKVGQHLTPVAFFVLVRGCSTHCDELACDETP